MWQHKSHFTLDVIASQPVIIFLDPAVAEWNWIIYCKAAGQLIFQKATVPFWPLQKNVVNECWECYLTFRVNTKVNAICVQFFVH